MHTPPWQASPLVQALPSSQGVVSATAVPRHTPLWQVSPEVQALPSSQLVPVSGVTVQLDVPSQVRVLHVSEVQVMAVPTHCPLPSQVSLKVQVLPSSHAAPVLGVTVQLDVPLQVRVLHVSEVQVMAVLWQTPASQVSMVQAFWSLQSAAVEQGGQPARAGLSPTPASQGSMVQGFWSLQSLAVEQGVQPAIAVLRQAPAAPQAGGQAVGSWPPSAPEAGGEPTG